MARRTPETQAMNPNNPRPVALASDLPAPPVWPLPTTNWLVLPVVPSGFPTGPFPPQAMGPIAP